MSDLRVPPTADPAAHVAQVATDGHGGRQAPGDGQPRERHEPSQPGAEELAVALSDTGRPALAAQFTQDADGRALIRIVDRSRGETVAVVTPEELRDLADRTGLPPGLLVHTES